MKRPFLQVRAPGRILRVEAVLFDKDGTILDSLGPWAEVERRLAERLVDARLGPSAPRAEKDRLAARALLAIGVSAEGVDRAGLLAGGTAAEIFEAMRLSLKKDFGSEKDAAAFVAEAEDILEEIVPEGAPKSLPMPGGEGLLRRIAGLGIPLGLATSDDERRTLADLRRVGWDGLFSFISAGDTAARPKPDPWSVEEFSRRTGVPADRMLYVGDTDTDLETARRAGVAVFVRAAGSLEGLVPRLEAGTLAEEASTASPGERAGVLVCRLFGG